MTARSAPLSPREWSGTSLTIGPYVAVRRAAAVAELDDADVADLSLTCCEVVTPDSTRRKRDTARGSSGSRRCSRRTAAGTLAAAVARADGDRYSYAADGSLMLSAHVTGDAPARSLMAVTCRIV
jgi:hypothetical protein